MVYKRMNEFYQKNHLCITDSKLQINSVYNDSYTKCNILKKTIHSLMICIAVFIGLMLPFSVSFPVYADSQSSLYESFIQGTSKAKYRRSGDITTSLTISDGLIEGNTYNIYEIIYAIEYMDDYCIYVPTSDVKFSYIDCGTDGIPELLVEINFGRKGDIESTVYTEGYQLFLIVKEINGELIICFAQDAWSRCDVVINYNGFIETSGSGGADVMYYDYGHVDANGDYHHWYQIEEHYD